MQVRPAASSEFDGPLSLQMSQGADLISLDPVKQGPWVEIGPLSKNSTVVRPLPPEALESGGMWFMLPARAAPTNSFFMYVSHMPSGKAQCLLRGGGASGSTCT
jgi:hypothetical protein